MKKIVVTTRKEELEDMTVILKDVYHFLEEGDDLIRVIVYLHDEELDTFIKKLRKAIDLRYRKSVIEVSEPEFVISSALQRTEEKAGRVREKPPVEKLIDSTKPHLSLNTSKISLTSIAGMIALTGLFLDNIPIVIGAMLLSPLLGPIYAFAINTSVGKSKNVLKSIVIITILLVMAVVFSAAVTILISQITDLSLTEEIRCRMDSNFIYMVMALLLGFASIFALAKDIPESIAGVAIAAALLPPAVVTGISLVLYQQEVMRPLILTLENVLGLMTGGLAATLFLHISPRGYYRQAAARRLIVRTSVVLIVLSVVLFLLSIWYK